MPQSVRAYQVKEIEGKSWTVPQKRSFSESDLVTDMRKSGLTVYQHCFGSDKMTVQDKEARGSGPSEVQLCMHTQRGFFFHIARLGYQVLRSMLTSGPDIYIYVVDIAHRPRRGATGFGNQIRFHGRTKAPQLCFCTLETYCRLARPLRLPLYLNEQRIGSIRGI